MPDDLRQRRDLAAHGFDIEYCLTKARKLLDAKHGDLETVEWAMHLIELARVLRPDLIVGKVLHARAHLRRGERDQAVELLESVRKPRPENFATGADEEAWYLANRLLGDLYLAELARPDLALECFTSYRQSSKSGADTLYKLGQTYEQLGDRPLRHQVLPACSLLRGPSLSAGCPRRVGATGGRARLARDSFTSSQ